ncbi:DUF3570 domain-containing protein [Thalassotalea fonticola]|uniref:DUF3570 domain-containing protein n=1 Tax=Thalassotalea fonticola TaxID=3065649 RepID=A0ABZ0GQ67_9GAMM|nr:DUF3570 domain-containing protein [Colwelliaceae bacterium S1-1]
MQLDKNSNLKLLLSTATCSLFGNGAQAEEDNNWKIDTALMYYGETDRVTAVEGIIAGTKEFSDEHFLNLKVTIDSLTGASPNGAIAQPEVQTFTRPSGDGSYVVKSGETPLDDTFKDTRLQVNAQWSQPLGRSYLSSAGLHASKEYDYLSLGANASLSRYFNQKNTTVSLGVAYSNDTIEPEGGIPVPFTEVDWQQGAIEHTDDDFEDEEEDNNRASNKPTLGADDTKDTLDLLLGLSQVINRRMIMQFNYSYSQVDGYMTDPFKVISVVNSNGESQRQLYEQRPDSRTKESVYWQTKYHFDRTVLDFSYRYMWDDWEIKSHTFDVRYYIPFYDGYLEPHVRYYMQEAADFYRTFLLDNESTPEFASADYRVGEMDGLTLGIKYGVPLKDGKEFSFRLEFFQQTPTNPGFEEIGVLQDVELFERVEAVIAQVSYSF